MGNAQPLKNPPFFSLFFGSFFSLFAVAIARYGRVVASGEERNFHAEGAGGRRRQAGPRAPGPFRTKGRGGDRGCFGGDPVGGGNLKQPRAPPGPSPGRTRRRGPDSPAPRPPPPEAARTHTDPTAEAAAMFRAAAEQHETQKKSQKKEKNGGNACSYSPKLLNLHPKTR